MEITDVRIRLAGNRTDRLKAFCTVTFDGEFVIRDVKVVEGVNGYFIAMPSRKMSAACPACSHKNQVRARFCEECGKKLRVEATSDDPANRVKLYRDIAHPITPAFREKLQASIIEAYQEACEQAPQQDEAYPERAEDDLDNEVDDKADEYDDDDETSTSAEEDDYSALIADLKGGARAPRRDSEPRDRPAGGRPQERGRRDEEAGPREKRHRGRRGGRPRPSPEPSTAEHDDDEAPAGEDFVEEPAQRAAAEVPQLQGSMAKPDSNGDAEDEDQLSLKEELSERTESTDPLSDSNTPFGAGIF